MPQMITLGILSDTHGWLDPELVDVFRDYEVDRIIHAGDIGKEDVLEQLDQIAPLEVVKGNIDGGELRFLPEEVVFDVGPRRIAMRHIAGSPRRPRKAARELIARERPDVFICGHSHIPVVGKVGDTLWINPGACGRHGFHDQRFAALLYVDKDTGEFQMERIHLGPRATLAKK
ncbi:MAG: metallophosphoesterase family protein [Persicimonas sp.]